MGTLSACGGGGGGSSSSDYSGTWAFQGNKLSDSCRSSLGPTLSSTFSVTQDGSSVTVQAGSLTLTGQLTDQDGFDAILTRPGTNGCVQGVSVAIRNASDGNADAVYVLGAQCRNVTCTVGYGGAAIRTSSKSLETGTDDTIVEELTKSVVDTTETTENGMEGGLLSALEETRMEIEKE